MLLVAVDEVEVEVVWTVDVVHCSTGQVVLIVGPLGPPRYRPATRVATDRAAATAITSMVRLLRVSFKGPRLQGVC